MPPAARITDAHECPLSNPTTPPTPHKGGPIFGTGVPQVQIGGKPAAVVGDGCTCLAPAMDAIKTGSAKVMIGGKPAARVGDTTLHGGFITNGETKVLIG